ncbi:tetratricopeptide repeat protein [Alicyclobacillus kakegawensis]|uniref:tetratricopeptide repeat protein n=1 Tax=Alicyclobacillus kakegawensis TaxID=392012 RepID=UPI0008313F92|nr:tetratricopeptide repeat protein [Alicyclobacillus kakegawensis]
MRRTATSDNQVQADRQGNVISLRQDADFFMERGLTYLERNNLEKALRAFRKTVEYDPDNPVNHCNLAGVLAELGNFEESNRVLLHILRELDPSMAECQFYLANNYANMGDYEAAEEHVLRYLDADPDGEFALEAREMLTILVEEFGGGKVYEKWKARAIEKERAAARRDGRQLLEEGQFEAAVECLERLVANDPNNLAARNNLSLAYYYAGHYERAIATAEAVLDAEPDNIHALCNLAIFSARCGPILRLYECIERLKKVFPLHYDQAMKVATTLGIVGEHETAYRIFRGLARLVDEVEPVLLHSLAAAAANSGRLRTARRYWQTLCQAPGMHEVARYYLDKVEAAIAHRQPLLRVSYQYDYPLQQQLRMMKERLRRANPSEWRDDALLRASLYWGLRHGTSVTRRAVIRTLALIADEDAQQALRLFVKRADIDWNLKAAALCALKTCDAHATVEWYQDGEMHTAKLIELPWDLLLEAEPLWQRVWQITEEGLREHVGEASLARAKTVWLAFLRRLFLQDDVRMVKPEIWAAGLYYCQLKVDGLKVRQKDAAARYGVSVSSVRKVALRLQPLFQ